MNRQLIYRVVVVVALILVSLAIGVVLAFAMNLFPVKGGMQ